MDALGSAGSAYRDHIYAAGFSGRRVAVSGVDVRNLLDLALAYVDQTLQANRRSDDLFHAYNILQLRPGAAAIGRLYPMLEGQVAILSSGLLTGGEALTLLRSLRASAIYRADQHSYMLYPDRDLPGFLTKNTLAPDHLQSILLVERLMERGDRTILAQDEDGFYHFNGGFRNAKDVAAALARLGSDPALADLVAEDGPRLSALFETTFDHASFTGRSGTFFAYEGLGSIYWHMVSKLLLAVQENFWWARAAGAPPTILDGLSSAYYDIRAGIGFNKSPDVYGAFPTDPYSHTPKGQGARQPGMTGQVKEEILTRWGELGVRIHRGSLIFDPALLRAEEFGSEPGTLGYVGVDGQNHILPVPANAIAFTLCQTPVILIRAGVRRIEIEFVHGKRIVLEGDRLDPSMARHIFRRDGEIARLFVSL